MFLDSVYVLLLFRERCQASSGNGVLSIPFLHEFLGNILGLGLRFLGLSFDRSFKGLSTSDWGCGGLELDSHDGADNGSKSESKFHLYEVQ